MLRSRTLGLKLVVSPHILVGMRPRHILICIWKYPPPPPPGYKSSLPGGPHSLSLSVKKTEENIIPFN